MLSEFLIPLFNSIFVSIPVDLSSDPELAKLEEKGVKGRYVSVESIKELSGGNTEWRMATSSSPGGRIPTFVVESTMASSISGVSIMPSLTTLDVLIRNAFVTGRPTLHAVVPVHQAKDRVQRRGP
jgi:Protein of unknown function (DUF3074)